MFFNFTMKGVSRGTSSDFSRMFPRGEIMKIEDAIKMLEAIKTEHGNLDITIGGEICGEAKTKEFRVETADLGTPIPYEEICKSKAFYSRHDWAEVEKLYKNGGTMCRYGHGNTPVKVVALY